MLDTVDLANETLWDGFFFSGAAPTLGYSNATGNPDVWKKPVDAGISSGLSSLITDFVSNPLNKPLRNPRMRLEMGGLSEDQLVSALTGPEGCVKIGSHLMVDGAFNVNSTSIPAWKALLSGLRDANFAVLNGSSPSGSVTAFPRFRNPTGVANDDWNGFRSLTDAQLDTLATNIVAEVRTRGPFLSLAEFVNRRVGAGALGLKGALQSAIDQSGFNNAALYNTLTTTEYPGPSKENVDPAKTGVGIPGYLTQADLLQSLAPVITVRSDTFTIRGYGEARSPDGKTTATAWCEAVVQRTAGFVDGSNEAHTATSDLNPTNQTFGRRFKIVSFRYFVPS